MNLGTNELKTTKRIGVLQKNGIITNTNVYLIEQYMDINKLTECVVICHYRKGGTNEKTK